MGDFILINGWTEKEVSISEIQTLLNEGYEVQVDSPDEWVDVNYFIDKGMWQEYILEVKGFENVRCNESHLFETKDGWKSAKELCDFELVEVLCNDGNFHSGIVYATENQIPIVDINVNHKNHRYYTNGISSHNTGVGKSLFMCHCASANLTAGLNVLYITMEMAEEKIAERIDANLLDISVEDLSSLPKDSYDKKMKRLKEKTKGKLIIKEYPTACAGSGNFRHLLNELKIKKSFVPDIIYIDYLNICLSTRLKSNSNANSYTFIKAIAEELRGLAVEYNVPIVSATQTTRSGYCVALDTKVFANNQKKNIVDVEIGDSIDSFNSKNKVITKFPIVKKKGYKITLESGKQIICSKEHLFPTKDGEKSIKRGLKIGEYLQVKKQ
jgi:hypothetical protein